MIHKKREGALRGLRINREILILRKPPIEVLKCKVLLKGTNTPTWECIGTVTWVYTNTHTRELNRYRPDQTGPDRTGPDQTHFKSFQSYDVDLFSVFWREQGTNIKIALSTSIIVVDRDR